MRLRAIVAFAAFWVACFFVPVVNAAPPVGSPDAPELILQTGHTGSVDDLFFSPDGTRLFSLGRNGFAIGVDDLSLFAWDTRARRLLQTTPLRQTGLMTFGAGLGGGGAQFALSADGRILAVSEATQLHLRRWITGQEIAVLNYGDIDRANEFVTTTRLEHVAFSPGADAVAGSLGKNVLVWTRTGEGDAAAWTRHRLPDADAPVSAIAWNRDGTALIIARQSDDKNVQIWTPHGDAPAARVLNGVPGGATVIAVSPEGGCMAAGGDDKKVHLWALPSGQELPALDGVQQGQLNRLFFSPDGAFLVAQASDGGKPAFLRWRKSPGGTWTATPFASKNKQISAVAFSPDSSLLALSDENGQVEIEDASTGTVRGWASRPLSAQSLAFAPDNDTLAIGGFDGSLILWSVHDGRRITSLGESGIDTYGGVEFVGSHLLTASIAPLQEMARQSLFAGQGRTVWDVGQGATFGLHNTLLAPDGRLYATAAINTLEVRTAADGMARQTFQAASGDFSGFPGTPVAFSGDGTRLLTQGLSRFWLLDTVTGKTVGEVKRTSPFESAFLTKNGQFVVVRSGSEDRAAVYEPVSGRLLRTTVNPQGGQTRTMVFSGDFLRAAFFDPVSKTVEVMSLADNKTIFTLPAAAAKNENRALLLDQTGDRLARTDPTGATVEIWTVAAGPTQTPLLLKPLAAQTAASSAAPVSPFEAVGDVPLLFSPDSKTLLLTGGMDRLLLWDIAANRLRAVLNAPHYSGAAFSPDSQRLVTGTSTGGARLWDAATGQPVATFISVGAAGGAIVLPDGSYLADPSALPALAFRVGEKVYPAEAFDRRFNRPDRVLQRLGAAPPALIAAFGEARRRLLRRDGLPEGDTERPFAPPTLVSDVAGVAPRDAVLRRVASSTLAVRVDARSSDADPLQRILLWVNGVPALPGGREGLSLQKQAAPSCSETLTVSLLPGNNQIEIAVVTRSGAESLHETATVHCTAPENTPGDLYVVALGVSDYQNPNYQLRYAAKDAESIIALFNAPSWKSRYGAVHLLPLTDKAVTRAALDKASAFLHPARTKDSVVLFFAGHGLLDARRNYFFGTYDIDFAHPEASGINYDDLENLLEGSPARWKLLLLDTCHAGEVDKDGPEAGLATAAAAANNPAAPRAQSRAMPRGVDCQPAPGPDPALSQALSPTFLLKSRFADVRRATGAVVLAASGGEEWSLEENGHGLFTFSVLAALGNARFDLNGDGALSLGEMQAVVAELVQNLSGGGQKPEARHLNRDADLAFPPPHSLRDYIAPTQSNVPADPPNWIRFLPDGKTVVRPTLMGAEWWDTSAGADQTQHLFVRAAQAVSFDGSLCLVDRYDRTYVLVETASGKERARLTGHTASIMAAVFSPNGKSAATGDQSGRVQVWDTATGKQRATFSTGKMVGGLVFNAEGTRLAVKQGESEWLVYDLVKASQTTEPTVVCRLHSVAVPAFGVNNGLVAVQYADAPVLCDAESGAERKTLVLPGDADGLGTVGRLFWSPDGKYLLRADDDFVLRVWDGQTGNPLKSFPTGPFPTRTVAFSPDGRFLAGGQYDGSVRVWDFRLLLAPDSPLP